MNRTARNTHAGWMVATLVALMTLANAEGSSAEGTSPEAVRGAAEEHVRVSGGEMTFDDPSGDGQLTLAFDHFHDGIEATEGGRQVVWMGFESADGTVIDVDFYVDHPEASGGLVVEDAVIYKVGGANVLSDARRAELDRKD